MGFILTPVPPVQLLLICYRAFKKKNDVLL